MTRAECGPRPGAAALGSQPGSARARSGAAPAEPTDSIDNFNTHSEDLTMSTATVTTNGRRARKQLSDQLDRLDAILDALAEGLPGAVADACREGARQAVKDAVVEILTNPELRG